jgi:hypothetical protein
MKLNAIQIALMLKTQGQPISLRTTPATSGPAKAHRFGLGGRHVTHGSDDDRLEHRRPDRHQQEDEEEAPETVRPAEHPVARGQDQVGHEERALVPELVRQCSGDDREEVEQERDDSLHDPALLAGEPEPAGLRAACDVERRDRIEPVPGHALEDLHRVGDPEGRWVFPENAHGSRTL